MTVLRWVWWLLGVGFTLLCFGYAVAFAGWGLSFWARPEPSAFFSMVAFIAAAFWSVERNVEELRT